MKNIKTNNYIKTINELIGIKSYFNFENDDFKSFLKDPLILSELSRIRGSEKKKYKDGQREDSVIEFQHKLGLYCQWICLSKFSFFELSSKKAHDLYIRPIDTHFEVKNSLYVGHYETKKSLEDHLKRFGVSEYVIQFLHDENNTFTVLEGVYDINNYIKGDYCQIL
ncbi:MAG: hypothetical protein WC503_01165 [Candidatus Shapirobacteria bacterium]